MKTKPDHATLKPVAEISIVMPVYNAEDYLASAIESILNQSFYDFELILFDDGSKDNSLSIMKHYEILDKRVRVISRENKGLPATLNEAINLASGSWIARMDADDVSLRDRLKLQMQYLNNYPDTVVLGGVANYIDIDGNLICSYIPPTDHEKLATMFPESPFVHPTVILHKETFVRSGGYNEQMRWGGEDVVLFAKMANFGKLKNLATPLINYRLVPGSQSRKPASYRHQLTEIINTLISGNLVTEQSFSQLENEAKKINRTTANFDYHLELAKLYLWSGNSKRKAINHLNYCLNFKVNVHKIIMMYAFILIPSILTRYIYIKLKKRHFGAPIVTN
jgi:glycosyltransferase involved in cell wall biosynthesis